LSTKCVEHIIEHEVCSANSLCAPAMSCVLPVTADVIKSAIPQQSSL